MSLDDRSRHELYEALGRALGDGPADTLMAHLPPTGWGDVARREDVTLARAATSADIATSTAEIRLEMAALSLDLRGEMSGVREELRVEMSDLRAHLARSQQRLVLWFTTTSVALNSALVGLVVALG